MNAENTLIKQICSGAEDSNESIKKILQVTESEFNKLKPTINKVKAENFNLENGNYKQRLENFRSELQKNNLTGAVLKTSDAYINEYISRDFYHLQYLTGFTGSLAFCIVTLNKAVVFVDGRYTLQAGKELLKDCYEIVPYTLQDIKAWVVKNILQEDKIALDSRVHTVNEVELFESILKQNLNIVDFNLVDNIWQNKAPKPLSEIIIHKKEYAVESIEEKKQLVLNNFPQNCNYVLLTQVDFISFLLNIRAKDINFNPVVLSYLLIGKNGELILFLGKNKLNPELKEYFASNNITVYDDENTIKDLKTILKGKSLGLFKNSPYVFYNKLQNCVDVALIDDFCSILKAVKSKEVINHIKNAHIKDGVAISKLLMTVENLVKENKQLSEFEIAKLCNSFRAEQDLYFGLSFNPIVGVDGNGAIVHYRPEESTSKNIHSKCNILIDSGGQYHNGTTDVTRSMSFANNEEYNKHYTLVLKGLLALSNLKFPKGVSGKSVDIIARQFLFAHGLQYNHGTGHGVGYFLNVHEGPQNISPANNDTMLQEGMVLSNEPGIYITNNYGIRLENLIVIRQSKHKDFLEFEELTLVPFNTNNILINLLTAQEKEQINKYHKLVFSTLAPYVKDNSLLTWLKEKTKEI